MICTEEQVSEKKKKAGPFCLPGFSNKARQLGRAASVGPHSLSNPNLFYQYTWRANNVFTPMLLFYPFILFNFLHLCILLLPPPPAVLLLLQLFDHLTSKLMP